MVQRTITIAPVTAARMNAKRKSITFYNASASGEIVSLGLNGAAGLAATNRDYVLNPATGLAFLLAFDGPDILSEWGAYATADTAILVIGETSDFEGV